MKKVKEILKHHFRWDLKCLVKLTIFATSDAEARMKMDAWANNMCLSGGKTNDLKGKAKNVELFLLDSSEINIPKRLNPSGNWYYCKRGMSCEAEITIEATSELKAIKKMAHYSYLSLSCIDPLIIAQATELDIVAIDENGIKIVL